MTRQNSQHVTVRGGKPVHSGSVRLARTLIRLETAAIVRAIAERAIFGSPTATEGDRRFVAVDRK